MIGSIKGKIIFKKEKFIILDVSGVGYKINVSTDTLKNFNEESLSIFNLSEKELMTSGTKFSSP